MKKILSAAAVALAFVVSASAQATSPTPSQSQSQPTTSPAPAQKTHRSSTAHKTSSAASIVTLTGCLRQGETPGSYQLDNAQMTSSTSSSTVEQGSQTGASTSTSASATTGSGTSAGMSSGMSGSEMGSVKLMASADIDLKDHVGHKVEVRGSVVNDAGKSSKTTAKDKGTSASDTMGSGSSASGSSATGTAGTANPDQASHTLKLRGFRHISDSCSQ